MEEVTPKFEIKTTDMLKQIENGMGMIHRQFAKNSNRMVNQLSESERHSMDLLKKMFNSSESHVKDLQLQLQKITENLKMIHNVYIFGGSKWDFRNWFLNLS